MITDLFGSLKENFIKKIQNPFWGTFIIVFILRNWQLFYSLLVFDNQDNRLNRINIIKQYVFESGGAWAMFLCTVLYTLLVLIVSYLLLNISTFIAHFSESRITPWVIKWATKGVKIVTKEQYDDLEKLYQETTSKLAEERRKRAEADIERDKVEKELTEFKRKIEEFSTKILLTEKELEKKSKALEHNEKIIKDLKPNVDAVAELTNTIQSSLKKSRKDKIIDKIFEENWINDFKRLLRKIDDYSIHIEGSLNKEMEEYMYVQEVIRNSFDSNRIILTALGQQVRELFLNRTA